MVYQDLALEARTDEESGQDAEAAPPPVIELVPSQEAVLQRNCGGL